ncbi:MAG: hypothetical protein E5V37_23555 [Mesorhizobium sp.]|uniref:hypothetical protein n=1 Tax=unclassified Mesorhizobium TaxID=325217 RepID=UPI000FCADAB8|nr:MULTISPECIES: hypothetical protein [unclassified Mesorhizobium]RUW42984.1 hypothetical protein EOA37_02190 [Mesorhizobium sp. M2A.F.Ca.ET.015.02.1.1]RVC93871.1 hypothetical protein EN739_19560 [Mesorhizobium sp. M2A.F.Ca.ET.017.03.2.1]RVC99997.1 hypothetical protein EN753_25235 [Mesorhizobium sp. M2A.F.Ca.ET.029.05.1.1]RWB47572.1 MAG: hypothetical protein EOQ46_05940 [Mesorhizobium sp.]RWB62096.1 MAG: hypothetical protein EOQ48_11755 [Mesorhizobium sp.]
MMLPTGFEDAEERIRETELAIQRSEKILAENMALRRRMRGLVDSAYREIDRLNEDHSAG